MTSEEIEFLDKVNNLSNDALRKEIARVQGWILDEKYREYRNKDDYFEAYADSYNPPICWIQTGNLMEVCPSLMILKCTYSWSAVVGNIFINEKDPKLAIAKAFLVYKYAEIEKAGNQVPSSGNTVV